MKPICLCALLLLGPGLGAAESPAPAPITNQMVITSVSFIYETNTIIYEKNVRVKEAQMELTCDLLTLYFSTNRPVVPAASQSVSTNAERIDMIIAEGNVVMIQQNNRATAHQAVYTATNEVIALFGNPIVEVPQGFLVASNIYFDRLKNKLWGTGGIIMSNRSGAGLFGTNSLGISLPGTPRPIRKPGAKSK